MNIYFSSKNIYANISLKKYPVDFKQRKYFLNILLNYNDHFHIYIIFSFTIFSQYLIYNNMSLAQRNPVLGVSISLTSLLNHRDQPESYLIKVLYLVDKVTDTDQD